jgi:hypothetical protein
MENQNLQTVPKLYTDQIGELAFRRAARLCIVCGRAKVQDKKAFCEGCLQGSETPAMERRWKLWGIAA